MVWRRGAVEGDGDEDYQPPMPWKAAVPAENAAERHRVVLEGWDDELTKDELAGKPPVDVVARQEQRRAQLRKVANLVLFGLALSAPRQGSPWRGCT